MQHPFRGQRGGSATATAAIAPGNGGGGGDNAYDSFIDFEGFPANDSSPSRSYAASSPSKSPTTSHHSTPSATTSVNIDASWIGRRGSTTSNNFTNHDRIATVPLKPGAQSPVVDWPVEVDFDAEPTPQPMLFELSQKQQQRQQQQQQQHRDQQIFRRKGLGPSGSSSTQPSYSSSRGSSFGRSGDERSPTNNNNGRGTVLFESYETKSNSNKNFSFNNNSSRSRDFGSTVGSQHRSPSILDNVLSKASLADALTPTNAAAPQSVNASYHQDGSSPMDARNQRNVLNATFPQTRNASNRTVMASVQNKNEHAVQRNQSNLSRSSFGNNSPATSSSSRKVLPSPPPPPAGTSVSISPQSVMRKTPGVVNKLVSLFSSKQPHQQQQQQQQQSKWQQQKGVSPRSKADSTNSNAGSGFQQLKQTITSSVVQFHVPPKQPTPNQRPQNQAGGSNISSPPAKTISLQHQINNNHNNPTSTVHNPPPAISPSRSNAQSSVTGYSGESSSYNPTGWPGTVDKRGSTYAMEPSYSESEGESLESPRRIRGHHQQSRQPSMGQDMNNSNPASQLMQGIYPTQNYRQNEEVPHFNAAKHKTGFSFDGSSAMAGAAELEEWLAGDADEGISIYDGGESQVSGRKSVGPIDLDSCYSGNQSQTQSHFSESKGGPIDLDAAYERRFDNWNDGANSGWREGRDESLANISETKTAADVQLEAALGMRNSHFRGSNAGASNAGSSRSHPMMRNPNNNSGATVGDEAKLQGIDLSGSQTRVQAFRAGRRQPEPNLYEEEVDFDNDYSTNPYNNESYAPKGMYQPSGIQPLSEEALRRKDMQSAPPRAGASMNFRGFQGFMDKTKDVPNLMDDLESEASTSLGRGVNGSERAGRGLTLPPATTIAPRSSVGVRASSVVSSRVSSLMDSGSDVFDGLQEETPSPFGPMEKDILNVNSQRNIMQQRAPHMYQNKVSFQKQSTQQHQQTTFATNFDGENLPYSTQFNPFSNSGGARSSNANARSSQPHNFDQGFPAVDDAGDFFDPTLDVSAITKGSADGFSQGHFEEFGKIIDDDFESLPDLSMYTIEPEMIRKMVRAFRKICTNQMEISSSEETMLYDFENLVDTKKAFALFEMRSRIMETDIDRGLERRGGTNVVDDIVLTPYFQATARVRDAVIVSKAWRDGATPKDVLTAHLLTRRSAKAHFIQRPIHRIRRPGKPYYTQGPQYWLEEVKWLDDTDFMLMRCQSLGAGTMKGFEMFTIGDCQSILLKMTSDNCTQLRRELRSAMVRQIEAEELMQEEIDLDGDENIVAEAEQLYLDATVEVKTLSIKLVLADKAFSLVRSRMEKLVETIESFLVQIENDDGSDDEETASYSTGSDDDESDNGSYSSRESVDKVKLVQRAKRAELSAEVAVREALLAKQAAEKIKSDKQIEIDHLKDKLADMETKSQMMQSQYLSGGNTRNSQLWEDSKSFLGSTFDKDVEGAKARKDRLKQKFRERQRGTVPSSKPADEQYYHQPLLKQQMNQGEEMYQHLDFYSRSLKSVSVNK